jgi:Tol biopolymer transport system component
VHSLETGKNKELLEGTSARYIKSGHIVYGLKSNIYAVPFNIDTLEITGSPVSLVDNVICDPSEIIYQFAVSESGTLVYASRDRNLEGKNNLVWVDRDGNEASLGTEPDYYASIQISPDGKKVASSIRNGSNYNIWVWDILRENWIQLTSDITWIDYPLWTVDGKEIFFFSMRNNLSRIAANGTGKAESVPAYGALIPTSFSPNGDILTLMNGAMSPPECVILHMKESKRPQRLFKDNTIALIPKISPDGKWVAYMNLGSGQSEIFVSPFPDTSSGKWKISNNGGGLPLWSPDNRELYYRENDKVMAVRIKTDETFTYGKPVVLFEGTYFWEFTDESSNKQPFSWDIHPDGKRFLMIKPATAEGSGFQNEAPPKINIILNWFEELKQKVPSD